MSIRGAIYQHLKDDTNGVFAIVGAKIFHINAPPGTALPYITFQQIGGEHLHHTTGISGLTRGSWQVSCFEDNPIDGDALSDAVRLRMDKFNGDMGTGGNLVAVRDVILTGELDVTSPPFAADEAVIVNRAMDFDIWVVETTS